MSVTIGAAVANSARIHIPYHNVWWAEVDTVDDTELVTGQQYQFEILGTSRLCTVVPSDGNKWAGHRSVRVVGGYGGLATSLEARHYDNDAGVKTETIVRDILSECGERIGTEDYSISKVGAHFLRRAGIAGVALSSLVSPNKWWVEDNGTVSVGPARASSVFSSENYSELACDPKEERIELSVDTLVGLVPGCTINIQDIGDVTVSDIDINVTSDKLRVYAYYRKGAITSGPGDALRAIVNGLTSSRLDGIYRYRVVSMHVDGRVNLQAVSQSANLPDAVRVDQSGAPGIHADLTAGAEVYVQFVDGNPADPIITSFPGRNQNGHIPESIVLGSDSDSEPAVARVNDTVSIVLPPAIFSGIIGIVPASGVLSFTTSSTTGVISTGSTKVKSS